jgi:hypothetical protein
MATLAAIRSAGSAAFHLSTWLPGRKASRLGRVRRGSAAFGAAAALALISVACGGDRSGGPTGAPEDVVRGAPAVTLRQARARVTVETPEASSVGEVTFPEGGRLTLTGAGYRGAVAAGSPPDVLPAALRRVELTDPATVLDLVRGAVDITPYGGAEVRGAGTIRYSFDVDLDVAANDASTPARRAAIQQIRASLGRPTFYADVWVDSAGRVRRVQVPMDPHDKRPGYREVVLPRLITIDFYDYQRGDR